MPDVDKWNTFWMGMAYQAATLSKDPSTHVGAVIVTPDNRQCSIGYNGFAAGIEETPEKWERPTKYEYVIHAEENCLINCPFDTVDCKIYITHQPCHRCIGRVLNSGITHVYYGQPYENLCHRDIWDDHAQQFAEVKVIPYK